MVDRIKNKIFTWPSDVENSKISRPNSSCSNKSNNEEYKRANTFPDKNNTNLKNQSRNSSSNSIFSFNSNSNIPELSPVKLIGNDDLNTRILTPILAEEIRHLLPARMSIIPNWVLSYSLEKHGVLLSTLYRNAISSLPNKYIHQVNTGINRQKPGYVLIIKDVNHNIFGAYINESPQVWPDRRYHGNSECFLWKFQFLSNSPPLLVNNEKSTSSLNSLSSDSNRPQTPNIRFKAFPYTGVNDYILQCDPKYLSLGGGDGHYGLWLNEDLSEGVSERSMTFGNEPLSDSGKKFEIYSVELWSIIP